MADTAPTSTAVASPAATTETKSDERSFSILKFIAYFLALGANAAACFMLLHCLNSETFWTVGTNNTSFYPTTNNYLTVAQEAATRYIGATFFIFVVTYFFIHDEIFYADGTNFARIFLNSNIPFKTAIAVGVTVQFAESFFRLAAVWAYWEDKWGVPSVGLQGATWGILFLASLLTYVALIAQHNTALTYPETLSGAEVPAACGWFAPIVHVFAFLANGVQIVVFVVALGKGTEKLLNPFAATTTSNKAGTATLVTYQYVNQSLLTQYLMSAIAGLFLAFYHFVRSFKGSFADSLPKNVQDFVVNGPKLVFAVEAFLRIIAFIRLQVNIPNQSSDEQIVSGQWVILLIATLLQFISSWAAAHTEYIEARIAGKAVASADSEKADTSRNIFFGIAAAVAWPLWLNSRP